METSPTGGQAGKPMQGKLMIAGQTNVETMSEISRHSRSQVYFYPVNVLA